MVKIVLKTEISDWDKLFFYKSAAVFSRPLFDFLCLVLIYKTNYFYLITIFFEGKSKIKLTKSFQKLKIKTFCIMSELRKIKRALLSVSDKAGIVELAKELSKYGVEIISTGGTAHALRESGLNVTEVSEITGFPEMMDGRVKTLHPKIHGAFLALRDNAKHIEAMKTHDITPIDLVVVNLYPFEKTIENEEVTVEEAVEQIDIGGPAMIRSASKNWRDVAVVTDPRLYKKIIGELTKNEGSISLETRRSLAALAFSHTSYYDLIISDYLSDQLTDEEFSLIEEFHPASGEELLQGFFRNRRI